MNRIARIIPTLLLPLALSGCFYTLSGGPGGGGKTPTTPEDPAPAAFTDFSSMKKSGTTKISGMGIEVGYVYDGATVTDVDPFEGVKTTSVSITTDSEGGVEAVEVDGPRSKKKWTVENSVDLDEYVAAESSDGRDTVVGADNEAMGFEYQTFGIWQTGRETGSGTAGAFSVGAATAALPAEGSGTFIGQSVGSYVDPDGEEYGAVSSASLVVDFAGKTAEFSTAGTQLRDVDGDLLVGVGLDMTASMTYGDNGVLTGNAETDNGMTGSVTGRFYGPGAQEAGGVFGLAGNGVEAYGGSFGLKR